MERPVRIQNAWERARDKPGTCVKRTCVRKPPDTRCRRVLRVRRAAVLFILFLGSTSSHDARSGDSWRGRASEATEGGREEAELHFDRGRKMMRQHHLDEALPFYVEGFGAAPANLQAWNEVGVLAFARNQRDMALRCFRTCVRIYETEAPGDVSHEAAAAAEVAEQCAYHLVESLRSLNANTAALTAAVQGVRRHGASVRLLSRLVVAVTHTCAYYSPLLSLATPTSPFVVAAAAAPLPRADGDRTASTRALFSSRHTGRGRSGPLLNFYETLLQHLFDLCAAPGRLGGDVGEGEVEALVACVTPFEAQALPFSPELALVLAKRYSHALLTSRLGPAPASEKDSGAADQGGAITARALQEQERERERQWRGGSGGSGAGAGAYEPLAHESKVYSESRFYALRAASPGSLHVAYLLPLLASSGGRLRVAYVGATLRDDKLAHALWLSLAHHRRVIPICFPLRGGGGGGGRLGVWQARLRSVCVGGWEGLEHLSTVAAAAAINAAEAQVVVDLDGWNQDGRPELLALRPAHTQVHLIQYPGSTGLLHIDFLVSDRVATPPEYAGRGRVSEDLALLQGSYQILAHQHLARTARSLLHKGGEEEASVRQYVTLAPHQAQNATLRAVIRAKAGLPHDPNAVVAACFNQLYKMDSDTVAAWMVLLTQVPGARLWLLVSEPAARTHLRLLAAASGVHADRLLLTPPLPKQVHLSAKAVADVFLDTPSFNGHSTVGEALHAGLPVVTEPREKMPARVAASILVAGGLSLMIARHATDYLALATRILTSSPARANCRRRTAHAQARVFDIEGWSGRWERLLLLLYDAAASSTHAGQQAKRCHVLQF